MTCHLEHPEDGDRAGIERRQLQRLQALLSEIVPRNRFWTSRFEVAGLLRSDGRFDQSQLATLDDVARLPLVTKAELAADQEANPPYGTNLTCELVEYARLHQTSGTTTGVPLRWLDTPASWQWFLQSWEQIYRMVGLRRDDRLAFPFSFGPFIGFWAAFEGAGRLGNLCLAGGGMSSQARLRLIEDNQATVVCCTPTYALRLAETAEEESVDLAGGSVRMLIVAGEPGGCVPATRARIESAWGARLFDHWGMTEIGSLAVECAENPGGMHVLETECLAEIIDSQTGGAVEPGAIGELVVTNLGRTGSPLIRYRTGDLVQADPRPCPCGRELIRLDGGVLSRADDMVTIRGNNVYPARLEGILREFKDVAEYRIEVASVRSMQHLRIEIEPAASLTSEAAEGLRQRVSRAIKDRMNFQADVALVAPGGLPRFELKGRRFFVTS